jgi:hypothetical protein
MAARGDDVHVPRIHASDATRSEGMIGALNSSSNVQLPSRRTTISFSFRSTMPVAFRHPCRASCFMRFVRRR